MKSSKIFAGVAMALDFNAAATDFFTARLKKSSCSKWEQLFSSGHQKLESIVLD
jgi:hypothetical protein